MTSVSLAEPIPRSALLLGISGLIPFFAAAVLAWTSGPYQSWAVTAGLAYGAVILSFLGGIRWGTAIGPYSASRLTREFSLSVLPSLAGWAALLMPPLPALCLLIAGFLMQALWDVMAVEQGRLPSWFGRLRSILTAGAVISLLVLTGRQLI
jgi:hypothetical protein